MTCFYCKGNVVPSKTVYTAQVNNSIIVIMMYKGYIGKVNFDDETHHFFGEVINTRSVITFQGESLIEIEAAFRSSVDDYLEWCKEDGVAPN